MYWGTTSENRLSPQATPSFVKQWAQQRNVPLQQAVMLCKVPSCCEMNHVILCIEIRLGIEMATIRDILQDSEGQTYMLIYCHTGLGDHEMPTNIHLHGAPDGGCSLVYALLDKKERVSLQQPFKLERKDYVTENYSKLLTPISGKAGAIPKQAAHPPRGQGMITPKAESHPSTALLKPDNPEVHTLPTGGSDVSDILQKLSEAIVTANHTHSYRKLKVFSGNQPVPAGEEPFEVWKDNAMQLLEEWSCTDTIKKQRLVESLRFPATDMIRLYKGVNGQATAHDYLQVLQDAYGKSEDLDDLLVKFLATKQKEHEKATDYINRLQLSLGKLFHKGAVTASELDARLSKQIQRGGLTSNPVMILLRAKLDDKVLPYSTLINTARRLEDQMCPPLQKEKENTELSALRKKVAELELLCKSPPEGADLPPGSGGQHRKTQKKLFPEDSPRRGNCFKCGKSGHFQRECPANSMEVDVGVLATELGETQMTRSYKRRKTRPTYSLSVGAKIGPKSLIHVQVEGIHASALLDTGSQVTIIYRDFYERHLKHIPMEPAGEFQLWGVGSQAQPVEGCIKVTITIPQLNTGMICPMELEALICPAAKKVCAPIILGTNAKMVQDVFRAYLTEVGDVSLDRLMEVSPVLGKECRRLALATKPGLCHYSGTEPAFVKPGETKTLRAIASMHHEMLGGTGQYLIESLPEEDQKKGWTLIPEIKDWRKRWCRSFPVMVQNLTPTEIRIDRHQKIGVIHLLDQVSSIMSVSAEQTDHVKAPLDFDLEDSPLPQHPGTSPGSQSSPRLNPESPCFVPGTSLKNSTSRAGVEVPQLMSQDPLPQRELRHSTRVRQPPRALVYDNIGEPSYAPLTQAAFKMATFLHALAEVVNVSDCLP
ncbi:hypothetical protein XENTR_v90016230mg [Pelobates cultripes]|uniref:CCHC-type domain-containing protein n=1 Tax=Pelobates cultripes TaxID=61616 RepID=A0AAD1SJ70_PELCU|nr:hypothetical protein XENTR_v90016230mg [Pelobates cultripes]